MYVREAVGRHLVSVQVAGQEEEGCLIALSAEVVGGEGRLDACVSPYTPGKSLAESKG